MESFRNHQRVRVVQVSPGASDYDKGKVSQLIGKVGSVVRLRRADTGAWVRMDEPLPVAIRNFPEGDERAHDFILYPDECCEVK